MRNIFVVIGLTALAFCFPSCDTFLDELPDNRTELDENNVAKILVSAYPQTAICEMGELSSDNTDQYPDKFPVYNRLQEDLYKWSETAEKNEDSPASLWNNCYLAISACNQALEAIKKAGNPVSLNAVKGEALVCRAYNHFLLAITFCKAYGRSADTDLGIPYMKEVETTVAPAYERGNLEMVYQNIEADLLAGLALIRNDVYTVPKYHFTVDAANAFAARFYLYYVQPDKSNYDKVIAHAGNVLGNNPLTVLRDWKTLGNLDLNGMVEPNAYIDAENRANLLLVDAYSYWPYVHGPWGTGERYAHGPLAAKETCCSDGPWGNYDGNKSVSVYYFYPWSNSIALPTKLMLRKVGAYTQVVDAVAGTGYGHLVNAAFTTDETLLCRAEAYVLKGDAFYPQAIEDLNVWETAFTRSSGLSVKKIDDYYGRLAYYTPTEPTVKKELHPDFVITDKVQENLIHCILHARRLTTLHEGLRWQDIKRYGITVYRRFINDTEITVTDELTPDDPRRAIQIPKDVIAAGMEPNPRNK